MNYIKKILFLIIPFTMYSSEKPTLPDKNTQENNLPRKIQPIKYGRDSKKNSYPTREYKANKMVFSLGEAFGRERREFKTAKGRIIIGKKNLRNKYPKEREFKTGCQKHHLRNIFLGINSGHIDINYFVSDSRESFELYTEITAKQRVKNFNNMLTLKEVFHENKEKRLAFKIDKLFKKKISWFLKWVLIKPHFPEAFFEGSLENILFKNNIPLNILAKMGRKNFNIFREKNNNQIEKFHDSVIDPKTGQRRANIFYSIYDEEIKRQKVLDEIELFII